MNIPELKKKKALYAKKYKLKAYKERPWLRHLHYARSRCFNITDRYTQRGIKFLLTEPEIKYLWFRDKAWLLKKPSLDRINGFKNYSFDNCRFIELHKNKTQKKAFYKRAYTPARRILLQYDLQGNFIKEWIGLVNTARTLKVCLAQLSDCCLSLRHIKTCGGYKWKYKQ